MMHGPSPSLAARATVTVTDVWAAAAPEEFRKSLFVWATMTVRRASSSEPSQSVCSVQIAGCRARAAISLARSTTEK